MSRIGGTETFDVRTIGESDNPEEYLMSCIEKSKGKKVKSKAEPGEEDEVKDEVSKKLKIQEEANADIKEGARVRISTIVIRVLDIARILLFNLNWEIRHGASLIIRAAARKANYIYYFTHHDTLQSFKDTQFAVALKAQILKEEKSGIIDILQDSVVRSLLILALDRFSDFIGDKSNIIVRDISSQAVAESLNFLKSQDLILKMIAYFKELLARKIEQGWEPKHGAIYLMYRLIQKIPKLTPVFFKEFCEPIHSRIGEHEEILEVACGFYQQILENDSNLFGAKALTVLCKSYLEAIQKLEDISYSVSPASRLIGDMFKAMVAKGLKEDNFAAEAVKTVMIKFFFHHMNHVRSDLFYMLSHWLIFAGKKLSPTGFKQVLLLMKMYIVGIYTEEHPVRRKEMIEHFQICANNFEEESHLGLLSLIAELCRSFTVKQYLCLAEDPGAEEVVAQSKSWATTAEETVVSVRVISTLAQIVWKVFEKLKPSKRVEALKLFNHKDDKNILCHTFELSVFLILYPGGDLSKDKDVEKSGLYPDLNSLLKSGSEEIAAPQIQALTELFLDNLYHQVGDYLGKPDAPEKLRPKLVKVFALLEQGKKKQWNEILVNLEASRDDLISLKELMQSLSRDGTIPYGVCKMQTETLDTKILKYIGETLIVSHLLGLYLKGLAASMLTGKMVREKKKPEGLNLVIKPLVALLKMEDLEGVWEEIFARGLFNLCLCFEEETAHPNHKIVSLLLTHCTEYATKMAKEEKEVEKEKGDSEKPQPSSQGRKLHVMHYFSLIFNTFKEGAFEKYPTLKEIFNSLLLIKLFLPIFFANCPADVTEAALTKLEEIAQSASQNQDQFKEFHSCLMLIFSDCNARAQKDKDRKLLLNRILKWLHNEVCNASKIGLETLLKLLEEKDKEMMPYSKIFIKRALKLINADLPDDIKRLVFDVFTRILTLSYIQDAEVQPTVLNDELMGKWSRGNEFLLEFRSNKLYNVDIPEVKSVKLRPYQMEGIAWVNFLFKYNLSGALCDDMGLGKTIQSLITVLIYSMKNKGSRSLIVCPNSLVRHWEVEAKKHFQGYQMNVAVIDKTFTGNWKPFKDVNLVITSDAVIIKSHQLFEKEQFLVGVLDEAHLIKNEKSKLSKCIKQLSIRHKLALTGTPIQNNLLELWSIFDFLMPNYLGSKEEFKKTFSRLFNLNLVNIDISKMDLNDEQTKDLQLLHQKVLPFIMRRLKDQVLQDLPEKIIQDYYCELTDVQKKVYKLFEDSDIQQLEKSISTIDKSSNGSADTSGEKKKVPLLQSLICMRKICNHPWLIGNKYFSTLTAEEEKDIKNFDNSGKFRGLRTLFEQLDFDTEEDNYDNPNKVLIFTRFIDTVALLESFLKQIFPTVKYVKIDGSIDSTARYNIIDKFFNEYDIKVMILTTKVGGLGLNLSCANIVVMFDHDFNPMNDIQAIERAHRLGQKKVVNVYRFIMKDTLEERIMG
jgi:SNF2 family DNA or RNA helicase